jgi:hypothetical protein
LLLVQSVPGLVLAPGDPYSPDVREGPGAPLLRVDFPLPAGGLLPALVLGPAPAPGAYDLLVVESFDGNEGRVVAGDDLGPGPGLIVAVAVRATSGGLWAMLLLAALLICGRPVPGRRRG